MQPLRVGLAGLGTVGAGVLTLLRTQQALITARCGRPIEVVAVSLRDPNKQRDVSLDGLSVVADARTLSDLPQVDIVVEVIGGAEGVARETVEAALKAGKPVVTANKALLARHGAQMARLVEEYKTTLLWEAAVAGAIPVVFGLLDGLAANQVSELTGILNGTCNYILSTMSASGRDFADVLREAQDLGYAEADPSFDIDGIDTAHKLSLLAALAFGGVPDFASVRVEGIRHVSALDIGFARELGYVIKLLAYARLHGDELEQRVQPCMVRSGSPLGQVGGPFNAVLAEGDFSGPVLWSGRGAGSHPTASAVVADLMALARDKVTRPLFGIPAHKLAVRPAVAPTACSGRYYVRLMVEDRPGVIAEVAAILRDYSVSMESFLQHGRHPGEAVPVVFTTHETSEAAMIDSLRRIAELGCMRQPPRLLRTVDKV